MIGTIARLVVIEVASTVVGNAIYNKYKTQCDAGIKKAKDVFVDVKDEIKKCCKKPDK